MWEFNTVPTIISGVGARNKVAAATALYGQRVGLIAGRHLIKDGYADELATDFRSVGLNVTVLPGPRSEPALAEVASATEAARSYGCSVIVGAGGGSTLDLAKAVAGLYPLPGDAGTLVENWFYGASKPRPDDPFLPWLALPTTAGTGSEATHVAVLSDIKNRVKQSIRSPLWFAKQVLIDPVLYVSAPPSVTAAAGMDAFTQALEAHTSLGATSLTKALTLKAAALIGRNLVRAYQQGDDLEARKATAVGSCMAGIALANARLGAVHGLAYPIGIQYDLAHGLVCAVLLPYVTRFNLSCAAEGYTEIAAQLGLGEDSHSPSRLLGYVEQMNAQMHIPSRLGSLGLKEEHIPALAEAALSSGSTKANPRPASLANLLDILRANI